VAGNKITEEFHERKLLVVEGKDDRNFLEKLIDHLNIQGTEIRDVEGKDNFNVVLPDLSLIENFPNLSHFAVIRDKNGDDAFKSICNILKEKMGFSNIPNENGKFVPGTPSMGIFIMPGETVKGSKLEDLCLKTVEDHPAMQCVKEFESCFKKLDNPPKNISKAKALAFLAAQPDSPATVGLGAQKKYWNLNSPALDELKQFLNHLR